MGRKESQIIAIESPHRERERKYVSIIPDNVKNKGDEAVAAYRKQKLLEVYEYVRRNTDEFVTADHPDLSPHLPPGISETFEIPAERTRPRQRVYFADAKLNVWKAKAEFRQELDKSYGVKQTIKRGNGATDIDPTLDRMEFPAKLSSLGINLRAVSDKSARKWLKSEFDGVELKPLFRMISQRLRTAYHPDGNQNITIELACDVILVGETVFGRVWRDPKLEIEIKTPEDITEAEAKKILDREEKRLERFGMVRQLESNAVMGYEMLQKDLLGVKGQALFNKMKRDDVWWTPRTRARFGLS